MKYSHAPSQWLLIVVECECPQFLYCREFSYLYVSTTPCASFKAMWLFFFEHLDKQHLLLAVATVALLQPLLYCRLLFLRASAVLMVM